jgi:hypothetical protein
VYGEWIKIRFPRKCYVQDVLYTPFSLATSIGQGYLLGSNDEYDWEPVYPINKTFINLNEMSLINVGGILPAIYTGSSKAFQYFTFMATTIQGTSGAAAGSTEKFAITNLRFTLYDSWVYHDNIISVGTFPETPVSNALDVNGNAYVSGQIITDGGINVLSGTSYLKGRVGIGATTTPAYPLDIIGDVNITGEFRKNGTIFTGGVGWTKTTGLLTSDAGDINIVGGYGRNIKTFNDNTTRQRILFQSAGQTYQQSCAAISVVNGTDVADMYLEWLNPNVTTGGKLYLRNAGTNLGGATYFEWWFRASQCKNSTTTSSWTVTSDHRIKENIKKANLKTCYNNVKELNLYRFKYIDAFGNGTEHDKYQLGFIAQQVNKKYKNSVSRGSVKMKDNRNIPDLYMLDVSQINMTTYGAVKRLIRIVERQSKRIKKLEEQLGIEDDESDNDDADEPYVKECCGDECDIDCLIPEPDKPH